jgi:hypothetical protein
MEADTFTSSHIGCTLWIIKPESGIATGNEGPRLIAAIIDDHTVTLTGDALVANQDDVIWRMKDYSERGYLTRNQKQHAPVIDNSLTMTAIGRLKRAMKIELAQGEEIDRIAAMGGLSRPRGLTDELWRRACMAILFGPKSTLQAFENLLTALYPLKNYTIYEDMINRHAELFLGLPWMDPTNRYTGRTFLNGVNALTSNSTTSITAPVAPHRVLSVVCSPVDVITADDG